MADYDDSPAALTSDDKKPEPPLSLCAADLECKPVEWLWQGRIARGAIAMLDGDPGLGKSTILYDLAARLTRGEPLPGDATGGRPCGVLLVSYEDSAEHIIVPRLHAARADLRRVQIWNTAQWPCVLPESLAEMERLITAHDVRLVGIDPVMAAFPGDVNTHRDADVRRVLSQVAAMAERTQAGVVFARHLTKAPGVQAIYRGGGSIAFIAAARTGLHLGIDPEDEERRILAVSKCNLGRKAPSLRLAIEEAPPPAPGVKVGRVRWDGVATTTADDLVSVEEERGALDEAMRFLRDLLAGGAIKAKEAQKAASDAGISPRTLARAKSQLRVKSGRDGVTGPWTWSL